MKNFFINVTEAPYNATGNGRTDDSLAIQRAINDASGISGCTIQIPAGNYLLNAGLVIQNANSVQITGEGAFGGTTLLYGGSNGDVITFKNCSQCNFSLIGIQYAIDNPAMSGNAITLDNNCYVVEIHDVRMDYCYNGIWIKYATETRLSKIQFRYLSGDYGVLHGGGGAGEGCYRAILDDIIANNPLPFPESINPYSDGVNQWAPNTSYNQGDIVFANNMIYQCSVSGKSSDNGSGPSGFGGGLRTPQNITDGSVNWNFVSKQIAWIIQDSNGFSLVVSKAGLLNGYVGYMMQNTTAINNPPMWIIGNDLECDHNYFSGMILRGGQGVYINNSWFGSCLTGNAINILPPFLGQVSIVNSRVAFASQNGILIGDSFINDLTKLPADILVQNCFIGGSSMCNSNKYNGVVVSGSKISLCGNKIGTDIANANPTQSSGVFIAENSDVIIVSGNILTGNISASCQNNSGGKDILIGQNIPKK